MEYQHKVHSRAETCARGSVPDAHTCCVVQIPNEIIIVSDDEKPRFDKSVACDFLYELTVIKLANQGLKPQALRRQAWFLGFNRQECKTETEAVKRRGFLL